MQIGDINNNVIAVLVLVALAVVIGNTAISMRKRVVMIEGLATEQSGTARFTISEVVSIKITSSLINFSSGKVHSGFSSCTVSSETDDTHICGTWDNYSTSSDKHPGFVIENDGNVYINLTVTSQKNATGFISGTNPSFKFRTDLTTDDATPETAACGDYHTINWTEADTSADFVVCETLTYSDAADEVEIDIQVTVPNDASVGDHTTTVTFTAVKALGY